MLTYCLMTYFAHQSHMLAFLHLILAKRPRSDVVSFSEGCWAVVPVVTLSERIPHLKRLHQNVPGGPVVKNLPANAGDTGLIPGWGRSHLLWSSWAHVPRLPSLCPRAWQPQLLSPCAATADAFAWSWCTAVKGSPHSPQLGKTSASVMAQRGSKQINTSQ